MSVRTRILILVAAVVIVVILVSALGPETTTAPFRYFLRALARALF